MNAIFRPRIITAVTLSAIVLALAAPVYAQRGERVAAHAGGHGMSARAGASSSINRPAARTNPASAPARNGNARNIDQNRSGNANRNVNRNVNRNQDININRNINVDVDDHHDHHDHWDSWDDHPFATAAAVTAGVAVTAAVIGSIVNSVPPSCVTTVVNGIAYQQCGSTWYQPQYYGTSVQYIVVNHP